MKKKHFEIKKSYILRHYRSFFINADDGFVYEYRDF